METMIDSGSPPDLVLDLSVGGESSEMIKSVAFNLGLPTVSSTMGGQNDIQKWKSLRAEQEDYLLQVRSPLDTLPFILRKLDSILLYLPPASFVINKILS